MKLWREEETKNKANKYRKGNKVTDEEKMNTGNYQTIYNDIEGRAIAQAVSRRLPTAAARVQTRVWSCGIL
jgi:hypothetical protein